MFLEVPCALWNLCLTTLERPQTYRASTHLFGEINTSVDIQHGSTEIELFGAHLFVKSVPVSNTSNAAYKIVDGLNQSD